MNAEPREIGGYRITRRIGEGGMGVVYAAEDARGGTVAVKLIKPELAAQPDFRARFAREAALAHRVSGVCTVRVVATDIAGERPWMAMEYVPGPTLTDHVARDGPLAGPVLDAFAFGTAEALASLHAARIVHRDLKPSNVILGPAGPVILDFGIARALDEAGITRTRVVIGSAGWISPERYMGVTAAFPGDVFAWGAVTAFAATGRRPFGRGADDQVRWRIQQGKADLAGVPDRFAELILRALSVDPAGRPASADLLRALAELLRPGCTDGHVELPAALVHKLISERWQPVAGTAAPAAQRASRIPDRPRARMRPVITRVPTHASGVPGSHGPASGVPGSAPESPPTRADGGVPATAACLHGIAAGPATSAPAALSTPAKRSERGGRWTWRRTRPHEEHRRAWTAAVRSWTAQPGTKPGYGARLGLATLSAAGWMLACFWFAAWLLSTKEPYNASADAIGSWMGVTAARYVAGLLPVFAIGAAVLALIRTEGLRATFVCGDLAAVLLGCGVRWVPSIPSRMLPDVLVRGFSGFGGWWGQYVVLVGFFGMCVVSGLWVRTWIVLTRWLGPGRTPGSRFDRRFHGLGS